MNPQDLAVTLYSDLKVILESQGLSDFQVRETLIELSTQAEIDTVEEMMKRLTEQQLKILDSLSDNATSQEIARALNLDDREINQIRAYKTAGLIEKMIPGTTSNSSL